MDREKIRKCPYCDNEMELGYIQSRDGVVWSKKKRTFAALPELSKSSVLLASSDGAFSGEALECYNCPACKKIIIDYNFDIDQYLRDKYGKK